MNKYLLSALLCMTYSVVASGADVPQQISPELQQAVKRLEKERKLLPDTETWARTQVLGVLRMEISHFYDMRQELFETLELVSDDFCHFPSTPFHELISEGGAQNGNYSNLAAEYICRKIELAIKKNEKKQKEESVIEGNEKKQIILVEQEMKESLMAKDRAFQATRCEKNRIRALGEIIAGEASSCSVQ